MSTFTAPTQAAADGCSQQQEYSQYMVNYPGCLPITSHFSPLLQVIARFQPHGSVLASDGSLLIEESQYNPMEGHIGQRELYPNCSWQTSDGCATPRRSVMGTLHLPYAVCLMLL